MIKQGQAGVVLQLSGVGATWVPHVQRLRASRQRMALDLKRWMMDAQWSVLGVSVVFTISSCTSWDFFKVEDQACIQIQAR